MSSRQGFPKGFVWGAATSAQQIEGSVLADGAGASIWRRFAHTPGMVRDGDTADVACDHYRLYREDIALMREIGLTSYRFSISWARVLPEGRGWVNPQGLGFYDRLVDTLLEAGIEPMATLYHWDLPEALDDLGGWLNRDVAEWFAEYTQVMCRALDGRIKRWTTLNEPWVVSDGGYLHGILAPGHRNRFEAPIASHNLMRAHGRSVQAYRANGHHEIGLVVNIEPKYPATPASEDLAATARAEAYMNRQYLEPACLGRYPQLMPEVFGEAWPQWPQADLALIHQPIDYIGVNYYTRSVTRADPDHWPLRARGVKQPQALYTETDWEVYPKGLTDTLKWIHDHYGALPLYVTENGAAFPDPTSVCGDALDDPLRVGYLRSHLRAVRAAIAQGVDVRGYFVWSLLDNFEWAYGFSKRFGIVHVDYATQKRTRKASSHFYSRVIASNGASLDEAP